MCGSKIGCGEAFFQSGRKRPQPGRLLGLETPNGGILLQRKADLIQPLAQAMLAERIDCEFEPVLKRRRHRLRFKIDMDRVSLRNLQQAVDCLLRLGDGQYPVLEGVTRKNVRKTGSDDCFHAHVDKGPGRVLTA